MERRRVPCSARQQRADGRLRLGALNGRCSKVLLCSHRDARAALRALNFDGVSFVDIARSLRACWTRAGSEERFALLATHALSAAPGLARP
jgi:hypothetical protein